MFLAISSFNLLSQKSLSSVFKGGAQARSASSPEKAPSPTSDGKTVKLVSDAEPLTHVATPLLNQKVSALRDLGRSAEVYRNDFNPLYARAERVSPEFSKQLAEFIVAIPLNAKQRVSRTKDIYELAEAFLQLAPDFVSDADLSVLPQIAYSCLGRVADFSKFLQSYGEVVRSEYYPYIKVAFRVATKYCLQNGESPLRVSEAFKDLLSLGVLSSEQDLQKFNSFVRGLLSNEWNVSPSILFLGDCLLRQTQRGAALALCAEVSTATKPTTSKHWERYFQNLVPTVLEFMMLGSMSNDEITCARQLVDRCQKSNFDTSEAVNKLFAVYEACRLTGKSSTTAAVVKKVQHELSANRDPIPVLNQLGRGVALSFDNLSMRRLIERMIDSTELDAFRRELTILRESHRADVVTECFSQTDLALSNHGRQVEVFKQSLQTFSRLREIRSFLSSINGELRKLPDGHPSLLSRFAYETAEVSNLACHREKGGQDGLLISQFHAHKLFDLDPSGENGALKRYTSVPGWSPTVICDFLNSRIVVTDSCVVLSSNGDARFSHNGVALSAVYIFGEQDNPSALQCYLVPTAIIDQKIEGCSYDFFELPGRVRELNCLERSGFYPEALAAAAESLNLPHYDVGAATCIGGLSNSIIDSSSELPIFGSALVDPWAPKDAWGNILKSAVLDKAEPFSQHYKLHQELREILAAYNNVMLVLENRYSTWKKGNTPDISADERSWVDVLPGVNSGYKMLAEAFRWHLCLSGSDAPASSYPKLVFTQVGKASLGAVDNFSIDTRTMTLDLNGAEIQLLAADFMSGIGGRSEEQNLEQFCINSKAGEIWQLDVRPSLAGLMPVLKF